MNTTKPSGLRSLFTTMMVNGYPVKVITSDQNCMMMLIQDYLDANNNNFAIAENKFYRRY